jgi:hypothetical protein
MVRKKGHSQDIYKNVLIKLEQMGQEKKNQLLKALSISPESIQILKETDFV